MQKNKPKPLDLLASEPFRFFFPFAFIFAAVGVLKWPLMFWRENASYPGQNHAFLMTEGFFGGFIIGFALTALPRMMESRKNHKGILLLMAFVFLVMNATLNLGPVDLGNLLFIVLMLLFSFQLLLHFFHRECLPPPGFILMVPAILCAITGAAMSAVEWTEESSPFLIQLRPLLLYQAWPLLPFLGVCPFFLPKFINEPGKHNLPDSPTPTLQWAQRAGTASILALGILISMALEASGWNRSGLSLRGGIIAWFLFKELPKPLMLFKGDKIAKCISLCLWALPTAYIFAALMPEYRIAWVHWSLVGGLSALTLTVATRVILGHSGHIGILRKKAKWFVIMIALIWVAMVSRVSGDIWPKIMQSHYIYAAICWIAAALIWMVKVLPKVIVTEDDESS
ncbi:MAG: hypothetical protein HOH33_07125 [Verrucomicrobia bacterium]|jgi:uncharacterized protein involved in response to NO|nr:hypothetical protein [Verrucomicrobiota bacterium]